MNPLEKQLCDYIRINLFNSFSGLPREELIRNHEHAIDLLRDLWIPYEKQKPSEKQLVLTIQDVGKKSTRVSGRFVDLFYYEDGHFVANLGDTDPYGSMEYWCDAQEASKILLDTK